MTEEKAKTPMVQIKEYFSEDSREVSNKELIELKQKDPDGYAQIRDGIVDGSLTY